MPTQKPPMPGVDQPQAVERRRIGFRLREDLAQRLDGYLERHGAAQVDALNAAVEYWLDAVDTYEREQQ